MTRNTILVCDDEADIRATIAEYLTKRGYDVRLADGGEALDAELAAGGIDAIILDVNMPGEDGLSILRRIRDQHRVAVIMLTAVAEEIDRIVGLELGADDYVAKPASFRELEARLRAVLRRLSGAAPEPEAQMPGSLPAISFAGYVLDRDAARLLSADGETIPLSPMEFSLMRCFAENPGRVLSRDQLLDYSQHRDWEPFDRSIDLRVSRLRHKIEDNPKQPRLIQTVRGLGYIFDPEGGST